MPRYCDPQLQVGENYSYLFNLRLKISQYLVSNPTNTSNSDQLEVVDRGSEKQFQVGENLDMTNV